MSNPYWKALQNKFHDGVHTIEGLFTGSQKEALKVATAAAHFIEKNGAQALRDAAAAAVLAAESAPKGTKLAVAVQSVIAVLLAEGVPVLRSAVNLAIEMALADAKEAGLLPAGAGAA